MMGSGVIHGSTEFMWAAYVVTWVALAGYAASLFLRSRRAQRDASGEES